MDDSTPVIRPRKEHNLSRRDIDPDAKKVMYRLIDEGHTAYLVGGGVRDLLLGRRPKDFDVVTDARPNRIKKLFRNCFLIGRRFRLAHIKFGDKIIETSTFRRMPDRDADPDDPEADLFHRDDNVFGTEEEDARRRDFTINGLFYSIRTFEVIDYVGGLADLEAGLIRSIGDPDIRFREDPVRMVRAVRFASRLNFEIEPDTRAAILRHYRELEKASPARMLEEIFRLFAYESAERAFRLLHELRIMSVLFPELDAHLNGSKDARLWEYLRALDSGSRVTGPPTECMMLSSLYYDYVRSEYDRAQQNDGAAAYADVVRELLRPVAERHRMPRRLSSQIQQCLTAQRRFEPRRRRRGSAARFVRQEIFPEALALYEIHLAATGGDPAALEPWIERWEEAAARGEIPARGRAQSEPLSPPRRVRRPKRRPRRRRR